MTRCMQKVDPLAQEFALFRDAWSFARQQSALHRWQAGVRPALSVVARPEGKGKN